MRILIERLEGTGGGQMYGLPLSIVKKNLVNLTCNFNGAGLKNVYLLEFHPCLANASRLPDAFRQAIDV